MINYMDIGRGCGDEKGTHQILKGNRNEINSFGDPEEDCRIIIKRIITKIMYEDVH
jgi:hypothetical protein